MSEYKFKFYPSPTSGNASISFGLVTIWFMGAPMRPTNIYEVLLLYLK